MAAENKYFKIRRTPLNNGQWHAIICPAGSFSRVVIENGSLTTDMSFRSDSDDGLTDKTIPMGQELDVKAAQETFNEGDIIGYVMIAAAGVSAIASFTR